MIELIQIAYSPFCIVQRRLLEFTGAKFKTVNIPNPDRSLVWKITGGRYYAVPVLRDGRTVIFESGEDTQDLARHLDARFKLGLFPARWAGVQDLLWRHVEGEVESFTFKLNDAHWREFIPAADAAGFVRHKERKFGRGCLERWLQERKQLLAGLEAALQPYEQMLAERPFLLAERPLFVDFDLFGMLGNLLFTGHYTLPKKTPRLRQWHARMEKARPAQPPA